MTMTSPIFWRSKHHDPGAPRPRVLSGQTLMTARTSIGSEAFTALLVLLAIFGCSSTVAHEVEHSHATEHRVANAIAEDKVGSLIRSFRETGDDRNLDAAWERLQPALEHGAQNVTVLVQAATVAQARHEFDTALALIDEALGRQPDVDQAWLLRASILLVRGRTAEALSACGRLRSVPAFVALTCRARVGIARGDQAQAFKTVTALLETIDHSAADADTLAWTLSVAGDAAAAVDPKQAISFYKRSLELRKSTQVRAALVDQLIAMDSLHEAKSALNAGYDALPLVVRRFIVALRMGESDTVADDIAHADHEFQHWIADRDWAHAREMARFYIDVLERPELAQRLAAINLELQREPEDLLLSQRVAELTPCVP